MNTILVVEDDKSERDYIVDILSENRYTVHSTDKGTKALEILDKVLPDLILLDLMLPDLTGETILSKIKNNYPDTSVIILTAKDDVGDIVKGFDFGADDYVTKPFNEKELLARIKTRLKEKVNNNVVLKARDITLDPKKFEVRKNDKIVNLTPLEFKLLQYLMANKNRVATREMILSRIWSSSPDIETRVVDVYIGYLRKKIDNSEENKIIHSVRGFGYVIKD